MAKVWRNSEGREFPLWSEAMHCLGANVNGERVAFRTMRAFGYELVEKEEPVEEFELVATKATLDHLPCLIDTGDRLIPGELYSVRKVKR